MNNCGTCKHWLKPEDRSGWKAAVSSSLPDFEYLDGDHAKIYADNYEAHDKTAEESDKKYGQCRGAHEGAIRIPLLERNPVLPKMVTIDASDYMAELYTLPDFGCFLWEATDA